MLLALLLTLAAGPEQYAVLVAVPSFADEGATKRLSLGGPVNDLDLLKAELLSLGYDSDDITTLTPATEQKPTVAGVNAALQALGPKTKAGDSVLFFFSGHGALYFRSAKGERCEGTPEPSGRSQPALLMYELGPPGSCEGRLFADELSRELKRWLERGVHVTLVLDACFAGKLGRAGSPEDAHPVAQPLCRCSASKSGGVELARDAGAPPLAGPSAELGIGKAFKVTGPPNKKRGRFLGIFAADDQTAPERCLPVAAPEAQCHGVLTYLLVDVMKSGAPLTAPKLKDALLQRYGVLESDKDFRGPLLMSTREALPFPFGEPKRAAEGK